MPDIKEILVPGINRTVKFQHRDTMRKRGVYGEFRHAKTTPPITKLPVDCTGNGAVVCPMDDNDTLGDCGYAMVEHVDNILTFRQGKGKESTFDQAVCDRLYLAVSGGDNGLDEDMVVNKIWKVGIGGNDKAIIVDSLDIDVTNIPLAQFAIDQFYTIQLAWSVPDDFIEGFATGTQWFNADTPNPNNGHYTPITDVDTNGHYRLYTWGTYCWVSPAFIASVQPQCFIAFSPRQFDSATGLDSKGRHITLQAKLWENCGGNPIPKAVIDTFPPITDPTPMPTPTPTPTPIPVSTDILVTFNLTQQSVTADSSLTVHKGGHVLEVLLHQDVVFVPRTWIDNSINSMEKALPLAQILAIIEAILAALGPILTPPVKAGFQAIILKLKQAPNSSKEELLQSIPSEHKKALPISGWLALIESLLSAVTPLLKPITG